MNRPRPRPVSVLPCVFAVLAASAIASTGACSSGAPAQPTFAGPGDTAQASAVEDAATPGVPFQPNSPAVYVAKVKNLLVGLPPTQAEVTAIQADPTQLKSLITGWMALPQYQTKMLRFFELAFQQTQVSVTDYSDQTFPRQLDLNGSTTSLLVQNASESFARTALALTSATPPQPLSNAFTTQTLMMTPALMELYAFLDVYQVDDAGNVTDEVKPANPAQTITVEASKGPIPLSESLDPTSPNYMTWYDPDMAQAPTYFGTACGADPLAFPFHSATLHYLLYGSVLATKSANQGTCTQYGGTAMAPQLVASDFTTWKEVTIRPPVGTESPTLFYDLATLRSTNELVLKIPRQGFFSTPAFFANWQTNTSNQMRVTMNQALIVALGSAVDGTDPTQPATTPGLDAVHASSPACFSCHQTLDPTRSILAATYSWNYHQQADPTYSKQDGLFAFRGVIAPVSSTADLGTTLAQHPLFPQAWAEKLCYYANSAPCDVTDAEFQRVVGVFTASGYSWNALVLELMASPLTTYASPTATAAVEGEIVAVSRRDHLCAALNDRLGFTDICGLDPSIAVDTRTSIPEIVAGLPSDGYGRGAVAPVLPNQPTLFYRAGTENICEAVAALVIDVPSATQLPGVKAWSSAQPDGAISDFVGILMALTPSDPRSTPAQTLLKSHFTAAVQSGAKPTAALQSTFVAACLAPSAVSIGM